MSEWLPNLLLAWGVQATGVLSPGPGVALILGVALSEGRRPALLTSLGIGCAAVLLATATVTGLAAVFGEIGGAMRIVRWVGAGYLLWLAWKSFGKAIAPKRLTAAATAPKSALRHAASGFVMQLGNPKALFFWLAIAALGSLQSAPFGVLAVFVAGAFVISFAGHGGYALLLSAAPARRLYESAQSWIEGTLGCFFLFASYRLATARS